MEKLNISEWEYLQNRKDFEKRRLRQEEIKEKEEEILRLRKRKEELLKRKEELKKEKIIDLANKKMTILQKEKLNDLINKNMTEINREKKIFEINEELIIRKNEEIQEIHLEEKKELNQKLENNRVIYEEQLKKQTDKIDTNS